MGRALQLVPFRTCPLPRGSSVINPRTGIATALTTALLAAGATSALAPVASAAEGASKTNSGAISAGQSYSRLIVHFAGGTAASTSDAAAQAEVSEVGRSTGHDLSLVRRLSTSGALVQTRLPLDKAGADRV